jgi:hypothetical protein
MDCRFAIADFRLKGRTANADDHDDYDQKTYLNHQFNLRSLPNLKSEIAPLKMFESKGRQ